MIDTKFLADIFKQMMAAKKILGQLDLPFSSVNVIFMGDFGQLRPVIGLTFFAHSLMTRIDVNQEAVSKGQKTLGEAYLWH